MIGDVSVSALHTRVICAGFFVLSIKEGENDGA